MENDFIAIIFRTVLVLIVLFIYTKLMGKKQLGQMNIYDYLVGITIGSIAADISLDIERNLLAGILSLSIYALSSVLVTFLSLKMLGFRKVFFGSPTILIDKGKIIVNNLKKEGIDINSLEEEARLNGFFEIDKIDYAILETNGQISFLANVKDLYVTNGDMNISLKENELDINLIQDGRVLYDNLKYVNKTVKWLDKKINEKGYKSYKDIFLFKYKNDKEIVVYDYEEKKKL